MFEDDDRAALDRIERLVRKQGTKLGALTKAIGSMKRDIGPKLTTLIALTKDLVRAVYRAKNTGDSDDQPKRR